MVLKKSRFCPKGPNFAFVASFRAKSQILYRSVCSMRQSRVEPGLRRSGLELKLNEVTTIGSTQVHLARPSLGSMRSGILNLVRIRTKVPIMVRNWPLGSGFFWDDLLWLNRLVPHAIIVSPAPTWNGDQNYLKWGPNEDPILSEMGTKWGPSAAEMGT